MTSGGEVGGLELGRVEDAGQHRDRSERTVDRAALERFEDRLLTRAEEWDRPVFDLDPHVGVVGLPKPWSTGRPSSNRNQ